MDEKSGQPLVTDHYQTVHEKKVKVKLTCKIVKQQHDDLRFHFEEVLAIKTLRPDLNKHQEDMGTLAFYPKHLNTST